MGIVEYIVLLVISAVISYAMMPDIESKKAEAFEDIEFPQADEGTPQAVIFGDTWTKDWMVLAVGNYRTEEIRNSGGKK